MGPGGTSAGCAAISWDAASSSSRANDTSAELAIGGLVFTKNSDVSIESENLAITPDTVTVRYVFLNQSPNPVTLTVAAPVLVVCGLNRSIWRLSVMSDYVRIIFAVAVTVATTVGVAINFSPLNPIKALYWSAVINGVVAVPIMIAMMLVAHRHEVMGKFTERPMPMLFGWAATAVMAAASGALLFDTLRSGVS